MEKKDEQEEYFNRLISASIARLTAAGASLSRIAEIQNEINGLYSERDYIKLLSLFERFSAEFGDRIDREQLDCVRQYLLAIQSNAVVQSFSETEERNVEPIAFALRARVRDGPNYQLIRLDNPLSFSNARMLIERSFCFNAENPRDSKLPFFITKEACYEGNVVSAIYPTPRLFTLVSVVEKEDVPVIKHFGQTYDKRSCALLQAFNAPLRVYRMLSSGSEEFLLFSDVELSLGFSKVYGMRVDLRDTSQLGDNARVSTTKPIVFVHSCENAVRLLSDDDARAVASKYSHELLAERVLNVYRHPAWFERLLFAWLFSGKDSGYPLHLVVLAGAGTGKSSVLDCLSTQFQEVSPPMKGGTLKGMVPHFGDSLPNEGFLCRCQRLGLVDEFFSIIKNSSKKGDGEIDSGTDLLLNILEHKRANFVTGKGERGSMIVEPRMKCLFISNNDKTYKFENMVEIAKNLNNPFLSRLLWYVMNPAHVEFVHANKSAISYLERKSGGRPLMPQPDSDLVSLYDYLNARVLEIMPAQIDAIFEKYTSMVAIELSEVYQARGRHHVTLLIDGIAKLNWVLQRREKLEVRDEDLVEVDAIWGTVIASWSDNNVVNNQAVGPRIRLNYLTYWNRKVYDAIEEKPNVLMQELRLRFAAEKGVVVDTIVQFLLDAGLIDQWSEDRVTWHFVPFWYSSHQLSVADTQEPTKDI